MASVLIPLPDRDFDVTEVAVPWKVLTEAGHRVVFATEHGTVMPACDPRLLDGVIFGKLGARPDAIACYRELEADPAFRGPVSWRGLDPAAFDGLFLPGGHAAGMTQYLGSTELHALVAAFWRLAQTTNRPVGAICHGVLVLARAGVLHGRRTTCLPKYMERSAYLATFWKLGRYYRTYPAYVEDEVKAALASPSDFERGPRTLSARGTRDDDGPAFVVEDGTYVSGRWPGDSWKLARAFAARLDGAQTARAA
ncbi:MAG TPA: type 1 glutamine amidotransferase domain-containing protein [Kofleriaceae bacterium]|nr:type 1 glutamine amidotransferase domain-containing protein [Kofleriaceae bacterium]